jgi:hypothetical protein
MFVLVVAFLANQFNHLGTSPDAARRRGTRVAIRCKRFDVSMH